MCYNIIEVMRLKDRELTDKMLRQIEKEIDIIFSKALKENKQLMNKLATLINSDVLSKKKKTLKYEQYLRLAKFCGVFADMLEEKTQLAIDLINSNSLEVYELNYNYNLYEVEHQGIKTDLMMLNKRLLKAIFSTKGNPFYYIALDNAKDKKKIKTEVMRELTTGLIKGEGYQKIAKRVKGVTERKKFECIRIVRTETTRVENLAKYDLCNDLVNKGIQAQKEWIATYDSRTRERHKAINHQVRDVEKPFSNGLMYPGDPTGEPKEIINCRCAMIPKIEVKHQKMDELDEQLKKMTYDDWKKKRG